MFDATKSPLFGICKIFKGLQNLKTRLITVYALNIFDLIATAIWISMFGLDVEANPIAKWMFSTNVIYAFKTIAVAAGLYLLNKFLPKNPKFMWMTWALLMVYGALAIYHLFLAFELIKIFSII